MNHNKSGFYPSAIEKMDFSDIRKRPWWDITALWRGRYYGTIKIKL